MSEFSGLFQAIIAFCAFFALLSGVIKMFVWPLEQGQAKLEAEVKGLHTKLDQLLSAKAK